MFVATLKILGKSLDGFGNCGDRSSDDEKTFCGKRKNGVVEGESRRSFALNGLEDGVGRSSQRSCKDSRHDHSKLSYWPWFFVFGLFLDFLPDLLKSVENAENGTVSLTLAFTRIIYLSNDLWGPTNADDSLNTSFYSRCNCNWSSASLDFG
jgi:hypothetical protein